ncbi:serpin family protein [Blastococcus xanthinilyticus]|uniref:serpin family protein n=1 Tax=Blastococcus xanthinilyticus TaxID=1564164 RepID=UPI001412BC4A|nr:serpin family protein [Blastococcus xanthinilyticus]
MTVRAAGRRGALAAAAMALLVGCGTASAGPVVHRGEVVPVELGALTADDVADAQTAFGIDLLHAVCAQAAGEDVLLSPTSAASALGLLHPAAGGRTAAEFGQVLHLPEWSPDLVAAIRAHTSALDALRYDGDLDDEDAPDALQVSNRLWTVTGLEPEPRYLDDLATAYDAEVRSLDFAEEPEAATDRINSTIAEDTRGIIEELFDQPLRPTTVAVLTNAVHLRARWAVPFTGTQPADFAAPGGEVSVDMMGGATGAGRDAAGWRSVELPYRDGTLAAVAVLPPEGTDPCAVDTATLDALRSAGPREVGVELPRISLEQSHQLLDVLTAMGLPASGDFSALGRDDLVISQVVQKTFLEVDEEGTEAAAASGVVVEESAGAIPQAVVTFDRPFLLLLTDTATRSPLFAAVVRNPSA